MARTELRRQFGLRIRELRRRNKWTQKEAGAKLQMSFQALNKYEGGFHSPTIEKLVEFAAVYGTTIEFLVTGDESPSDSTQLHNVRLLERLRALQEASADDQETVVRLIDAVIVKSRAQKVLEPLDRSA